jgi:hypothetical protein
MTAEELLQAPYNKDNWMYARDLCSKIMEQYTQTFPVPILPMPDDSEENMWSMQHIHKKTLLNKRRYEKPFCEEGPYADQGFPAHDDAKGWTTFLEDQKCFYHLKIDYQATGTPDNLMSAFMRAHKKGYYPPLWVLDHWLWPGFAEFSHNKGRKRLDSCLGLSGTQRAGNLFDQRERCEKEFFTCFRMYNLVSATGLSIAKCAEILSMEPGKPAHTTIATMYKKRRKDLPEEILSMALYYEELCKKTGEDDTDNPCKNEDDLHKVFAKHGAAFRAAAKRHDMTVTSADYKTFLKKVNSI